tara:strand:- start:148 stop:906 length:759 start_codon:yes stop_codon:yes gene_type:complete
MAYIGQGLQYGKTDKAIVTATGGQTTFSPLTYTVGSVDVFLNGVLLDASDYTATNGTSIVLDVGASAGDLLEAHAQKYISSFTTASTQFTIAGDGGGSQVINDGDTVTFEGGTDITAAVCATDTVKVSASPTIARTNVAQSFTAAQRGATLTDTSNTGNITLNYDTYQNFVLTLTGNVTLDNPTTDVVGQSGVMVLIQDGTGSRTLSLGTDYETVGGAGITLSTAAGALDVLPYFISEAGKIQLGAPQLAFA